MPDRGRQIRRLRSTLDEPLGMPRVGGVQDVLPLRPYGGRLADVDDGGRQEADRAMTMFVVVPGEEHLPERTAILDRAESLGKLGTVLERLEVRFREGVIVGNMRAAVGFRHAEIGQEQRDWLAAHAGAPVRVDP